MSVRWQTAQQCSSSSSGIEARSSRATAGGCGLWKISPEERQKFSSAATERHHVTKLLSKRPARPPLHETRPSTSPSREDDEEHHLRVKPGEREEGERFSVPLENPPQKETPPACCPTSHDEVKRFSRNAPRLLSASPILGKRAKRMSSICPCAPRAPENAAVVRDE